MSQHSLRAMTRSALAVAGEALAVAWRSIPACSSKFSPKKSTQHQHFAILTVRQFLDLDHRGVQQLFLDWSGLRDVLDLQAVPHWTAIEKVEKRLMKKGASTGSSTPQCGSPASAARRITPDQRRALARRA